VSAADASGRRAIVTGGGRGIGAAIVQRLLADGLRVVIADLAPPAEMPHEATYLRVDVRDPDSVEQLFADAVSILGGLDLLVNNAGIADSRQPISRLAEDEWQRVIDVNLGGTFRCSKAAFPLLAAAGGGAIVNLSSTWGLGGVPGFSAYTASKSGIIGLTRSMAAEGGPQGIRVNAVSPGYVANDMGDALVGLSDEVAVAAWAERDRQAAHQPIARQSQTAEIAAAVAFLGSPEASFITGTVVPVDGGQSSRLNTGERADIQY
jgi:NAD(P)-dependent dehydrogenase (short-subunit alcohol dehydrogenase family)